MPLKYRLALDLGTNSIGWCMLRLDMEAAPSPAPNAVIRAGVRVFGDGRDPMSGASLAVARRDARALRRNRDRKSDRKRRVMDALVSSGLFPTDSVERREVQRLDPYECRSRGLTELLSPYEFGRALFHLNQRRGFQSNRKTDGDDADGSLMKGAISSLREQLAADGFRTVGQWLAVRHGERKSVRSRLRGTTVKDRHYDLYFDRAMIRQEYDALWEVQQGLDPEMFTAAKRDAVAAVMFYQRDLRPVRPGRCTFEPDRDRAARALPTSQRIRIYQEVNNLGIETTDFGYTPLTRTQRDLVVGKLEHQKTLSFDAMRRALKLAGSPRFNLESAKRKDLKGNSTSFVLAADDRFGSQWHELAWEVQDVIVQRILDEEDEETLVAWLGEQHGLTQEQALRVSAAPLTAKSVGGGWW
jgi:CRISPR-associated endonuclease Csn1